MAITARNIEEVTFSKPPIGKRGYNEDEVDAFLDLLVVDVREMEDRDAEQERIIADLERQVSQAPQALAQPPQQPLPPAPPPPAPVQEAPSAIAARIIEAAERTADQVARETEELSEKAIREAKDQAAATMAEARYEASKLVDAARAEKEAIESRLAELRRFEENYRTRLDTYIEGQLHALRADARVDPAS